MGHGEERLTTEPPRTQRSAEEKITGGYDYGRLHDFIYSLTMDA
jgi:hypothetical protein